MAHLTKKALRAEFWNMLSCDAKKSMKPIKKSYLDSMMADVEDYAKGKVLKFIKDNAKALSNDL